MKRANEMKIYSYVVDHDVGHEPNPYFGVCTLCRCKFNKKAEETMGQKKGRQNVVELAKPGNWIIGTGGESKKSAGNGKLIYVMRVDEKLPREKYYKDRRFANKNPERPLSNFQKYCQFALVSRHFYYFGAKAIPIPEKLKHFEKKGPGFRYVDPDEFRSFLEWLKKKYRPGKHGNPCYREPSKKPEGGDRCKSSC